MTYVLKVDGRHRQFRLKAMRGFFMVAELTFTELTRLSATAAAAQAPGRAQFDPLIVDIAGLCRDWPRC